MPRKKHMVKREIRRITSTAASAQEAAQAAHEVAEELDRKAVTEEAEKDTPGSIRGGFKKTATYSDLKKMFPMAKFTPEETIPLTFNGVRVQALAGYEMEVPQCFKDIYDKHRRAPSATNELRKQGYVVDEGVGALN